MCVSLSHPPCQHGTGQGNEALALEEAEALHQRTGSPSVLDCSLTRKRHRKEMEKKSYSITDCVQTDNRN